jgi:outer membrane receptor protein involved in Fe transport
MIHSVTRAALAASAAGYALTIACPATAAQTKSFDVPAQPAATGISELARQADIQILVSEKVIRGKRTRPVRGTMSIEQALRQLLGGTGLRASSADGRTFTLAVQVATAAAQPPRPSPVVAEAPVQSAPAPVPEPVEPVEAAQSEAIVVTGSRTIRNGDNSPTPVTVITTETLQNVRPTSLTESIQVMPVFSGSRSQTANPSAAGATGGGNGTAAQLNLRNVGSQRNLVLMDGRRVPPTSFTGIVDADVIPQLLIKRVDVVTGGVSAVYGSDAVTGVINFITDTDFTGFKAQAQAGVSELGDDGSQEIGLAWGVNIGERSHFEASYEFRNSEGIGRRSERDWFNRATVIGNGTTIPYRSIVDSTLPNQPFGGRITCGATCAINGQYFANDGVLAPFVNGTTYTGVTATQSGGAGGYYDLSLKASQRSHQFFARFDTEFADDLNFFVSASANFKENRFYGLDLSLSGITLNRTNAFLAPVYQAQIPTATFTLGKIFAEGDSRLDMAPKTRQLTFVTGFDGKIGDFTWDVGYVHGESRLTTDLRNNPNQQKLSAALDAVTNAAGQIVCYAATQAATAAAYANCVPLNVFGPSASSAAARDYIFDDTHYVATTKQDDIAASIGGSPFATWAGPVNVALSGEWRSVSFQSQSNSAPDGVADCTNLRYNCVGTGSRTLLLQNVFSSSPKVSMSVWEVAGEASVPLLKDVSFFKLLEVTGAARYTKYDTVGDYWTWKAGVNWAISDDLRVRGTISRDIRAPTLGDLYAPTVSSVATVQDIKNLVSVQVTQRNQSNPNLTAEIGDTKTIGVVFKPSFVPGFSLAVDYYDISINNAIVSVQGAQAVIQNGCNLSGIALYCNQIERDSTGRLTAVITSPVNLAQITTSGLDVEMNYQGTLFGNRFMLRGLAAYQPHIRYIQPGVTTVDQGGVAFGSAGLTASPSLRLTGIISYELTPNLRIDILERWRNALKLSGDPTVTFVAGDNRIEPYAQTSLNVAYTVNKQFELSLNIQNLFDADPPVGNAAGTGGQPGYFGGFAATDDVVGRYFTVAARVKF